MLNRIKLMGLISLLTFSDNEAFSSTMSRIACDPPTYWPHFISSLQVLLIVFSPCNIFHHQTMLCEFHNSNIGSYQRANKQTGLGWAEIISSSCIVHEKSSTIFLRKATMISYVAFGQYSIYFHNRIHRHDIASSISYLYQIRLSVYVSRT